MARRRTRRNAPPAYRAGEVAWVKKCAAFMHLPWQSILARPADADVLLTAKARGAAVQSACAAYAAHKAPKSNPRTPRRKCAVCGRRAPVPGATVCNSCYWELRTERDNPRASRCPGCGHFTRGRGYCPACRSDMGDTYPRSNPGGRARKPRTVRAKVQKLLYESGIAAFPDSTKVQTLLFAKTHHTKVGARAWAQRHGFKAPAVEETAGFYRLRQIDPSKFVPGTFRTIPFGTNSGVKAVIGVPG